MNAAEWIAFEVIATAIAVSLGTLLGIGFHMLLARSFGWVYDPVKQEWL